MPCATTVARPPGPARPRACRHRLRWFLFVDAP